MPNSGCCLMLPQGGSVTLRPVTADDQEFLIAVYASTREEELDQAKWEEGQRDGFIRWQFAMQQREYDVRFPHARYEVILVDDEPAGRIWVGEDENQIRLLEIGLLPRFQNRGVGKSLIARLMEEARAARKPLRHMVFVLNNNAHRFYERLGFVIIEEFGAYKHMEWKPTF